MKLIFLYWGGDEKEKIRISELQYAILNKHRIMFDYFNSELQKTERVIEPLRLVFKSHAWYIAGYCRLREDIRIFRLSRVKHLQVMPEIFERELPSDYSFVSEDREECSTPPLRLKFSPEIAHRVYDEFQENQVTLCKDGNYYVTVQYELNNWTFHYLLSFGKYVEIVEPEIARIMLKERAADIVKIYT